VIALSIGTVDAAKASRQRHIKVLTAKANSCQKWIKKAQRKLKNASKFYRKKNWHNSKTGCQLPLSMSLRYRETNWHNLRFQLHHKKRKLSHYRRQVQHLRAAPIRVTVPKGQAFMVGSKDETCGNQSCQWDGQIIKLRVPYCLEDKFGKYVSSRIGGFERKVNRLPSQGALTWHFYRKNGRWCVAVQFSPLPVKRVSRTIARGCIGIDLNPGSIGWALVDSEGNLRRHGQIPIQTGLPRGKQEAAIRHACFLLLHMAIAVNDSKHVWSHWNQLNNRLKRFIHSRHAYYGISNWEFLANPQQGSGNTL
jgi:hypothetical protein